MDVLKALFSSKKGVAAIAGILCVVAQQLGFSFLTEAALLQILGVIGAFIVGQGIADNGKEAAKVTNGS